MEGRGVIVSAGSMGRIETLGVMGMGSSEWLIVESMHHSGVTA